jgi:hypothetical protein
MLKKGMLVLCKPYYNNQNKSRDHSISVVLDADIGNNNCHIRDIYRVNKGLVHKTMNWSNVDKGIIEGVIVDISDIEYDVDFVAFTPYHIKTIEDFLIETIPEYLI